MKTILIVLILIISSLVLNSKDIPPCSCVPLNYWDTKPGHEQKINQDTAIVFDTCGVMIKYHSCDSTFVENIYRFNSYYDTTILKVYAKYLWQINFINDAIKLPKYPKDTAIFVTWEVIDTSFILQRKVFKELDSIYGHFVMRKMSPEIDTGALGRIFYITFDNWVPIVEIEKYINKNLYEKQRYLCYCEFQRWPAIEGGTHVKDSYNQFKIMPNPVSDYLYIESPGVVASYKDKYEITSYLGCKYEVKAEYTGQDNIKLNCSALPAGLYFIKINNQISKFIIYR